MHFWQYAVTLTFSKQYIKVGQTNINIKKLNVDCGYFVKIKM